ncbi:P-loop containing nucleoside triphosphate hydrolase protein [Blastocladiella britannica]|nr:P-loop containing nucleoside triphosphate hydrolase protein [Blastocladiella britannica]
MAETSEMPSPLPADRQGDVPSTNVALSLINRLRKAMEAEHAAEHTEMEEIYWRCSPQQIQLAGLGINNLKISGTRTGLGGQCLVDLEPATPGVDLFPPHKLRTGDILALESHQSSRSEKPTSAAAKLGKAAKLVTGVVYRVGEGRLTLVLDDDPSDDLGDKVRVTKRANEITFKRLSSVLEKLQLLAEANFNTSDNEAVLRVGLTGAKPFFGTRAALSPYFDANLNSSQQEAVSFVLRSQDLSLIHGPPGTGKTQTLIEVIRQLVSQDKRVLVCGPSNISVDNIVERLAPFRLPMLRVGHAARVLPSVLDHTLDTRVKTCDEGQLVKDVTQEMDALYATIRKTRSRADRRKLYDEMKLLRKELRTRERNVVDSLIRSARIVLTTLNGSASRKLDRQQFDVVVIDEAAQALEPECWLALLRAPRAILAGDHLQLPPTIKADSPTNPLRVTLFERLIQKYGDEISRLLTVQYRMHESIMQFSSDELYGGRLTAHESVAHRTLLSVAGVEETDDTRATIVLIDTAGCDMFETTGDTTDSLRSDSKANEGEADLAAAHVDALVRAGVPASEIVVLTPYNAQVAFLKARLRSAHPTLEIGSVDGMQGREKDAVVLSLVRSNSEKQVGFLAEARRLNVAITRARRHLCVVCDSETVSADPFCEKLASYLSENGDLRYPGY